LLTQHALPYALQLSASNALVRAHKKKKPGIVPSFLFCWRVCLAWRQASSKRSLDRVVARLSKDIQAVVNRLPSFSTGSVARLLQSQGQGALSRGLRIGQFLAEVAKVALSAAPHKTASREGVSTHDVMQAQQHKNGSGQRYYSTLYLPGVDHVDRAAKGWDWRFPHVPLGTAIATFE
jgi:hypothetical protein